MSRLVYVTDLLGHQHRAGLIGRLSPAGARAAATGGPLREWIVAGGTVRPVRMPIVASSAGAAAATFLRATGMSVDAATVKPRRLLGARS